MTEFIGTTAQVAVYIDFDNIVMSRYDELHGREAFRVDGANNSHPPPLVRQRLAEARVDLGAIIDYASTFGTVVISRAYADWSRPVSRSYAADTLKRSIDLVQMFPIAGTKNGADIRLAIDATEHLAQYPNITHIMVVAGDSDYVALAQRCKRRGRTVIGVGAGKSVGKYWESACNEFRFYAALLDATTAMPTQPTVIATTRESVGESATELDPAALLRKAARLMYLKATTDWISAGGLKMQMKRLDPAFDEASLGFKTFSAFLKSVPEIVDFIPNRPGGQVYLRELGTRTDTVARAEDMEPPTDQPQAVAGVPTTTAAVVGGTGAQQTDLSGQPLPAQPPAATPLAMSIRRQLNLPVNATLGTEGEQLVLRVLRAAWAESEGSALLQRVIAALVEYGVRDVAARRAANVLTQTVTYMLRDQEMTQHPNPELVGYKDEQLLAHFRVMLADRIRHRLYPEPVKAEDLLQALYLGEPPPSGADAQFTEGLTRPGLDAISEAIGPLLVPPPVLWDVAAAFTRIPHEVPVGRVDQFTAAITGPLVDELERDPDTVPMPAVHQSLVAAGLIGRRVDEAQLNPAAGWETVQVVARVLASWVSRCAEAGLRLEASDPVSMDALYRLLLPDRFQIDMRAWVQQHVGDS
jgi:uncharacterized protein (TIGR00288 family)